MDGSEALHVYRVTVRGQFKELTAEQRQRLLQQLDAHDIFLSRFTHEGTFTYDRQLVAFNFRYEVRVRGADSRQKALDDAELRALSFLEQKGLGHRIIRVEAMDMADMWR